MSEDEDLELQSLQRQLDDAFQTTRPRPDFEDELWLRMQARRPIWRRLRDALAALVDSVREAPAVPSAAVAIALILIVGAGILAVGLHPGPAGTATSLQAGSNTDRGATYGPNAPAPVPAPKFAAPAQGPTTASAGVADQSVHAYPNNIYLGPATLTWTGHLDVTATALPVFRYQEPTPAAAIAFAASVGARPSGDVAPGGLGAYAGDNFTLVLTGSVAQPAVEPSYKLSDLKSAPAAAGSDPVAAALARLAAHNLVPAWSYRTLVQTTGDTVQVKFLRSFDLQAQGQAGVVDGLGSPYGIEVDLSTVGTGSFETGPLPLSLASVDYPIISADQAIRSALASSAQSTGAAPYPVVRLTTAELVYKLVWAGDHSFYEPAFLFWGQFTDHGTTYVKRVLVPAIAPSLLSP
jgi:hypothetical protein